MDAERRQAVGTATRTLDIALILHADHELNASTFAARVIAATSLTFTPLSPARSARSRARCTAAPMRP
jgi:hypothetical protein